jgi:hypothetical protein
MQTFVCKCSSRIAVWRTGRDLFLPCERRVCPDYNRTSRNLFNKSIKVTILFYLRMMKILRRLFITETVFIAGHNIPGLQVRDMSKTIILYN